jgi:hypothetical protein
MTLPPSLIGALIIAVIVTLMFRLGRANRSVKEYEKARDNLSVQQAKSAEKAQLDHE